MAAGNEIVLGIRLKADGGDLVGTLKASTDTFKQMREEVAKNTNESQRFNEEQKRSSEAMGGSTREAQKFADALKREAETLGYSTLQQKAYTASKMEFSDAQALSVARSLEAIQAYEKQNAATQQLTSSTSASASAIGIMTTVWGLVADKVLAAVGAVKNYIQESALLAARNETLGVVMGVVGRNAGYTAQEMLAAAEAVQKSGITMNQSREAVIKLAQAQINLTEATKLARIAQDAAVIGNTNSSEAMERLIYGITSGQTEVLRTMGINVNFEQSYKKLAAQLGVTTEQLTEQEKVQGRTNVVTEYGTRIAGAYEAAMGTAGKQINSLARYTEDLKVMRGEVFNEALVIAVEAYTKSLKDATVQSHGLASDGSLKEWGRDALQVLALLADGFMLLGRVVLEVTDRMAQGAVKAASIVANVIKYTSPGGYWLNSALDDPAGALSKTDRNVSGFVNERSNSRANSNAMMFSDALAARIVANNRANQKFATDYDDAEMGVDIARGNNATRRAADIASARAAGGKHGGGSADPYAAAQGMVVSLESQLATLNGEGSEFDKVVREITEGTKKWTEEQKVSALSLAGEIDLMKGLKIEREAYLKQLEASRQVEDEVAQLMVRQSDAVAKLNTQAYETAEKLKFETSLIGKSNVEREKAIALRELEASKAKLTAEEYERNASAIIKEIEAKAAAQKADNERTKALADNQRMVDDVSRSVGEAIQRGGKTGIKGMLDDLKEAFKKAVFRIAVQPYINQAVSGIAGALGLGVSSSSAAATGGSPISSILNLRNFNAVRNWINGFTGSQSAGLDPITTGQSVNPFSTSPSFEDLGGSFGDGVSFGGDGALGLDSITTGQSVNAFSTSPSFADLGGSFGDGVGSLAGSGTSSLGASVGGDLSLGLDAITTGEAVNAFSTTASFADLGGSVAGDAIGGTIGGTLGSYVPFVGSLVQLAMGNARGAAFSAAGAAIGSIIPGIGTVIGAVIGTIIGALTGGGGGGPAQSGGYDFVGTAAASGIVGNYSASAFNSKEFWQVQTADWGSAAVNPVVAKLFAQMAGAARAAGYDPSVIDGKSYAFGFKTYDPDHAESILGGARNSLLALSEAIAKDLIPNIDKLKQEGETLSETFDRVTAAARTASLQDIFGRMAAAFSLQDSVRELNLSDLSPLLPKARLDEANARYGAVLAKAQDGDITQYQALSQLSRTYLQEARSYFASSADYTAIYDRVQENVKGIVDDTLAEQSIRFAEMGLTLKDIAANTEQLDTRIAAALQKAIDTWQEAQVVVQQAAAQKITDAVNAASQAQVDAIGTLPPALAVANESLLSAIPRNDGE